MPLANMSHRACGGGFAVFGSAKNPRETTILCGDAPPPGQHLPFRRLCHGRKHHRRNVRHLASGHRNHRLLTDEERMKTANRDPRHERSRETLKKQPGFELTGNAAKSVGASLLRILPHETLRHITQGIEYRYYEYRHRRSTMYCASESEHTAVGVEIDACGDPHRTGNLPSWVAEAGTPTFSHPIQVSDSAPGLRVRPQRLDNRMICHGYQTMVATFSSSFPLDNRMICHGYQTRKR